MADTRGSLSEIFGGGGEMGRRMREFDWSRTPIGPASGWPTALRTTVRIMLTSRQAMYVWWGPDLRILYNDGYRSILGGKHPAALGQPVEVVWREIWDQVEPRTREALRGNKGTYDEALLLLLERYGYQEEGYFTFSYSPIPDDTGGVGGIFGPVTEETQRIIGERQLALLRDLAMATADARTIEEACVRAANSLETNPRDLPFALIYLTDREHHSLRLVCRANFSADHQFTPPSVSLDANAGLPFADVLESNEPRLVTEIPAAYGTLPSGAWDQPPQQMAILPIAASGQSGPTGLIVVGLNPYRQYDENYQRFLDLVSGQITAAIGNAQAYEAERQRAEALAELDRAKTRFFSNVSHEFRTPLTLLLGPLEDAIAAGQSGTQRENLELAHRNALRLLRLVNTLLDFSRIEAGRIQASYQLTDLPAVTADLASTFRAAAERAGLRWIVECPPLPPDVEVYVDRDMWEKIVLNLLSNAFKFTLAGEVKISIRQLPDGGAVQLIVRDTGSGVPAEELPRLFERFHRVQGTQARTHEGTGIGLALVQELVKLHGGTIEVESTLGQGTTFVVTMPTGTEHLPQDRIDATSSQQSTAIGAAPFVEEALRWLPGPSATEATLRQDLLDVQGQRSSPLASGRILFVDDNADMRQYVARLLSPSYEVESVGNGEAALAAIRVHQPDLVLADILMPRLDGLDLLRTLRADPATRDLPVVLLSARAGEEASTEGLAAGADDYLVKPFTSRELLARVGTHVALSRMRAEASQRLETEVAERTRVEEERTQLLIREQAARLEAEAAVQARDDFLSIAAHELRTPVAAIKGMAQLTLRSAARDGIDPERTERALRTIEQSVDRLTTLINDLLDVSRLQQGQLTLRPEPIDVVEFVRDIAARHAALLDHAYTLNLETPAIPVPIAADPGRLEQVFDNLFSNAVKYSPDGGVITLAIQQKPERVEIAVRDSGIGLPAGEAERIFEPFGRASNATARNLPGMGLGLHVSRRIVELHGGHLWAESDGEDRGTNFRLWLPLEGPGWRTE